MLRSWRRVSAGGGESGSLQRGNREKSRRVSRQARQETYKRMRLEAWRGNGDPALGSFNAECDWSEVGHVGEKMIKVNRSP